MGTLLLCAVREIRDYTVQVSLPFNIPATVHVTDISEPLKSLAQRVAESIDNEVGITRYEILLVSSGLNTMLFRKMKL